MISVVSYVYIGQLIYCHCYRRHHHHRHQHHQYSRLLFTVFVPPIDARVSDYVSFTGGYQAGSVPALHYFRYYLAWHGMAWHDKGGVYTR